MNNSDGVLRDMKSGSVYSNVCVKQSHQQSQVSHGLVCFVPGAGVYSYLGNKGSGPLVFLLPRFPVRGHSCPFWDQHLSLISSSNKGLCSIKPSAVCVWSTFFLQSRAGGHHKSR